MDSAKELVINSPKRKQYGGYWFIFSGIACFLMWYNSDKVGGGDKILLGLSIIIFVMGIHRVLTYSRTTFIPGNIPSALKETYHFGYYKIADQSDFNEISLLRRENLLPYCQLYAFSNIDFLKTRISPDELKAYETGAKQLPGLIIVDHTTKKECDALNEKIWRFYDLWDEPEA